MTFLKQVGVCLVLCCSAGMTLAQARDSEPPRGLWQSAPDALGLVYHVRTKGCGQRLCGRIERVKDRRGVDAPSNAVSHLIFDRLRPQADGSFLGRLHYPGTAPLADTRVTPQGNALRLEVCGEGRCETAEWKRLR